MAIVLSMEMLEVVSTAVIPVSLSCVCGVRAASSMMKVMRIGFVRFLSLHGVRMASSWEVATASLDPRMRVTGRVEYRSPAGRGMSLVEA